jgi:hypothetical protein
MKICFVCSVCKSAEVVADAYAEWNMETQSWELQNVLYRGAHCNSCDGPTSLEEETCDE